MAREDDRSRRNPNTRRPQDRRRTPPPREREEREPDLSGVRRRLRAEGEEDAPVIRRAKRYEPAPAQPPRERRRVVPSASRLQEEELTRPAPRRQEQARPAEPPRVQRRGRPQQSAQQREEMAARQAARPQPPARVQRSRPQERTRVATGRPESILDEPPITIDSPTRAKEIPSAAFGSWRAKRAMPVPRRKFDEDGHVVDKAVFAADQELHFRHELKFYINYRDYIVLRQALKSLLTPDDNGDENNSYHIRSLYFDDKDEKALVDKMAGVEERNKFRIRIYNFSDEIIRLEKKIKRGQYIAKKSMTLTRREYEAILAGRPEFLLRRKEDLAREMFLEMRLNQLRPRVVVDYMREAYVMPYESVRITFDKELKSGRPTGSIFDRSLPVIPIADADTMILEVKFNRYLPDYVRGVLAGLSAPQRSAISKYVHCRKYE